MRRISILSNMRRRGASVAAALGAACLVLMSQSAAAQQFNSDNQWVAPHGVATIIPTVGQEYSMFQLVAALLPETEFNLGVIHYWEGTGDRSEAHNTGSFYVKRRLSENEAGTGG